MDTEERVIEIKGELFGPDNVNIPTPVLVKAMLEAQADALWAIRGVKDGFAKIELFWVVYCTQYRQLTERWIKEHG